MSTASSKVFLADLDRMNAALREYVTPITDEDGLQWFDPTGVPAGLRSAYRSLVSYGYANGLMA